MVTLENVGHGRGSLSPDAAASLLRMDEDRGSYLPTNSLARLTSEQIRIFTDRYRQQASGTGPYGDVRYWDGARDGYPGLVRWVRVSGDGTVAVPRTSEHETGEAADFASAVYGWLEEGASDWTGGGTSRANDHGWYRNVPGERWHYRYVKSKDKYASQGRPSGGGSSNVPEEDDMFSDDDRKLLQAAVNGPKADYSLVRLRNRPEVFLSTNRMELRWIKTEADLKTLRYTLRGVNAPAADRDVEVIDQLQAYGTIIGERPVQGYEGI